ncbi:MAG: PAS domain-containing protein [Lutibacter sp.]|uniref:PAS domain-containing sensor histidine kinase n=1 Tax=Lutibacter sp. TaxID=1925666 RepID=UPI0019F36844|nr:PAS domain-containing sensor histidine kinase [Lutibacter sp.]NOR27287.1 PAS domain-containing protein [Lutibacter sp.]
MDKKTNLLIEKIKKLEEENSILKKQQIEITKAKELYLKIFEEFPALIWRSRLDKLCDYFNKTWLEFTGRTMEQEFGNGWTEGVHPDDFDFCLQTYVTAFDKREAFLMEYRMKNKFGEYRWISDYGRPFYDLDNTFLGYIGSCYDITENKNNELSLIEMNATKDKFFSIIAHDLKGPLCSMAGLSEYLVQYIKEKNLEKIEKIANAIQQSSNNNMNLLSNLMTWAQSQSGRMDYNPEYFEIDFLVQEAKQLLNDIADKKSIIINNTIKTNSQVFADKEMISSVLRNLISNALKFTNTGGKITISAENKENMLTMTINDEGVGISEDNVSKLFQIAKSQSTSGTENEKGTGLGLILCKEFIKKNNGKIWVKSTVGTGSSFFFSLPITHKI